MGHILISLVTIRAAGREIGALRLGPMAVLPSRQGQGVGPALARRGLEACRARRHGLVVVLGHSDFYPRIGFERPDLHGFRCDYECPPEVFMTLELSESQHRLGPAAVVSYRPEFRAV